MRLHSAAAMNRILPALLCTVALAGCGVSDAPFDLQAALAALKAAQGACPTTPSRDACAPLENTTFVSDAAQECGRGGAQCSWSLQLQGSQVTWRHSDVVETGILSCATDAPVIVFPDRSMAVGSDGCGHVTVEGVRYSKGVISTPARPVDPPICDGVGAPVPEEKR